MKKILVIGSLNMDYSIKTGRIPKPGETILGTEFKLNPGGKGANQAYALGKLGSDVSMMGLVGNDQNGSLLIDNLKSVSVNVDGITKINDNTGVAFVAVSDSGENSIIAISGANGKIMVDYINQNIKFIDEADIIVMQLEIPLDVVKYIATYAKAKGKIVVLDPAPARSNLDDILKYIDIMKPNETELEILSGMVINNNDDILCAARKLIDKGVSNVIVSLGSKGSMLVNKDGYKKYEAISVDVVDTTAAGDSFTAGLVSSLANDKTLNDAILFGHKVASLVVSKRGAQESIPSMNEINDYYGDKL